MDNENLEFNQLEGQPAESLPTEPGKASEESKRLFIKQEKTDKPYWYVVYTYSGYENKVMTNLLKTVENNGLQDLIYRSQEWQEKACPAQAVPRVCDGENAADG